MFRFIEESIASVEELYCKESSKHIPQVSHQSFGAITLHTFPWTKCLEDASNEQIAAMQRVVECLEDPSSDVRKGSAQAILEVSLKMPVLVIVLVCKYLIDHPHTKSRLEVVKILHTVFSRGNLPKVPEKAFARIALIIWTELIALQHRKVDLEYEDAMITLLSTLFQQSNGIVTLQVFKPLLVPGMIPGPVLLKSLQCLSATDCEKFTCELKTLLSRLNPILGAVSSLSSKISLCLTFSSFADSLVASGMKRDLTETHFDDISLFLRSRWMTSSTLELKSATLRTLGKVSQVTSTEESLRSRHLVLQQCIDLLNDHIPKEYKTQIVEGLEGLFQRKEGQKLTHEEISLSIECFVSLLEQCKDTLKQSIQLHNACISAFLSLIPHLPMFTFKILFSMAEKGKQCALRILAHSCSSFPELVIQTEETLVRIICSQTKSKTCLESLQVVLALPECVLERQPYALLPFVFQCIESSDRSVSSSAQSTLKLLQSRSLLPSAFLEIVLTSPLRFQLTPELDHFISRNKNALEGFQQSDLLFLLIITSKCPSHESIQIMFPPASAYPPSTELWRLQCFSKWIKGKDISHCVSLLSQFPVTISTLECLALALRASPSFTTVLQWIQSTWDTVSVKLIPKFSECIGIIASSHSQSILSFVRSKLPTEDPIERAKVLLSLSSIAFHVPKCIENITDKFIALSNESENISEHTITSLQRLLNAFDRSQRTPCIQLIHLSISLLPQTVSTEELSNAFECVSRLLHLDVQYVLKSIGEYILTDHSLESSKPFLLTVLCESLFHCTVEEVLQSLRKAMLSESWECRLYAVDLCVLVADEAVQRNMRYDSGMMRRLAFCSCSDPVDTVRLRALQLLQRLCYLHDPTDQWAVKQMSFIRKAMKVSNANDRVLLLTKCAQVLFKVFQSDQGIGNIVPFINPGLPWMFDAVCIQLECIFASDPDQIHETLLPVIFQMIPLTNPSFTNISLKCVFFLSQCHMKAVFELVVSHWGQNGMEQVVCLLEERHEFLQRLAESIEDEKEQKTMQRLVEMTMYLKHVDPQLFLFPLLVSLSNQRFQEDSVEIIEESVEALKHLLKTANEFESISKCSENGVWTMFRSGRIDTGVYILSLSLNSPQLLLSSALRRISHSAKSHTVVRVAILSAMVYPSIPIDDDMLTDCVMPIIESIEDSDVLVHENAMKGALSLLQRHMIEPEIVFSQIMRLECSTSLRILRMSLLEEILHQKGTFEGLESVSCVALEGIKDNDCMVREKAFSLAEQVIRVCGDDLDEIRMKIQSNVLVHLEEHPELVKSVLSLSFPLKRVEFDEILSKVVPQLSKDYIQSAIRLGLKSKRHKVLFSTCSLLSHVAVRDKGESMSQFLTLLDHEISAVRLYCCQLLGDGIKRM